MGEYVPDNEITIGMSVAGGQAIEAALADPAFMAKPNMAGELAARIFRAMRSSEPSRNASQDRT